MSNDTMNVDSLISVWSLAGLIFNLIPLLRNLTGPYKLNGVPLRRVNQRYVIATSTKVPLAGVNVAAIDDKFFARAKEAKKGTEEAMFEGDAPKATVISAERKAAQTTVDAALIKNIDTLQTLSAYISAKFSLSKQDKPHAMVF